jgi:hypothetical protein
MATQKSVPRIPSAKPVAEQTASSFQALKGELSAIASWTLSPNDWKNVQVSYTEGTKEGTAIAFIKAIKATYERP